MSVSVCLRGTLDDFSVQDILQVISFGRKTGYLSLETDRDGGAIVFYKGRILASIDDGELPLEGELESWHGHPREDVLRRRIANSIDRLARCREGDFTFLATPQPPQVIYGRDVACEALEVGIEVIDLLLELASRQDSEAA